MTLYRVANDSKVVEALIRAAEKLTNLICEVSDMFEKGTE